MKRAGNGNTAEVNVAGICELVLESEDVEGLARFYRELGLEPLQGVAALAGGDDGA